MSDMPLRIHVLYESSSGGLPHGCSEIRLLRPLSHPTIRAEVNVSAGLVLPDEQIDVVIIERLWDYSFDRAKHAPILAELVRRNVAVIFEIDDDLLSLASEAGSEEETGLPRKTWLRWILRLVDGVIVSTPNLAARLAQLNENIEIVPNALDDRLFHRAKVFSEPQRQKQVVVGYMGTPTHTDDLFSILGPLRRVLARCQGSVAFEIVGIGDNTLLIDAFRELPFRLLQVPPGDELYERFVSWMLENLRWDIGIAPLIGSSFTRSKSDIKFLDYSAQGIPGIFSNVPAYSKSIRHWENGVLAQSSEEWEKELQNLIADGDARIRIARNAHADVWQNRMLETEAYNWLDAIRKLVSRKTNRCTCYVAQKSLTVAAKIPIESRGRLPSELTRNEKILHELNLSGFGLEIGPSYSPVAPKRAGFNVEILDHTDADALREKYRRLGVDISNIEEIDYIWSGEPLDKLTGKVAHYDWIIASHVIEHTPDLIAFLQQCDAMLKPRGILSLAIPDYRYCFDRFRSANTPGDIIQAHLEQRRRPPAGIVWDHFSMITKKGGTVAWEAGHEGNFTLIHSIEEAKNMFLKAKNSESYIDVHNWRFTPSSFRLILDDLGLLGLSRLVIRSAFPTVGCEFLVQLEKVNRNVDMNKINSLSRLELLQQTLAESCGA